MNVAVLYEQSGRVRQAFAKKGHLVLSCDLMPAADNSPNHWTTDVRKFIDFHGAEVFDLIICFPECRYLTNSNAWRWEKIKTEREEALANIRWLMGLCCPRIAIENPAGAIGTNIRPADQYVDPWQFGEPWAKHTGLWLKGLPKLVPTVSVKPNIVKPWINGRGAKVYNPGRRKYKERILTFSVYS
jgi:hypothetical protein